MKILVVLMLVLNTSLSFAQQGEGDPEIKVTPFNADKNGVSDKVVADELEEDPKAKAWRKLDPMVRETLKAAGAGYKPTKISSNGTIDSATYLAVKTITGEIDPNKDLIGKCEQWEKQDSKLTCHNSELEAELAMEGDFNLNFDSSNAPGIEISHCDSLSQKFGKYCFVDKNSKPVLFRSTNENKLLMEFLCSDMEMPTDKINGNPKLAFGHCLLNQVIETDEMNCICDGVNADSAQGLAWHCTRN